MSFGGTRTLTTENLVLENAREIAHALDWYKLGADFADAIHLCISGLNILHTFDANFCKSAHKLGLTPEFKVLGR